MKLLLDECVPQEFRHAIAGHDVYTVAYMGWSGVKNGRLLDLAAAETFAALITTDRNIPHQQNPATLPVAVVIIEADSNDVNDLNVMVPSLLMTLQNLQPRTLAYISAKP